MIRAVIIALLLFSSLSAADFRVLSLKTDHCDPSFEGNVSDGRHLVLFPVITDSAFMEIPSFEELVKPIRRRSDRLAVSWYPTLKKSADGQTRLRLIRAEDALLQDKRLEIPKLLAVFESENQRFIQSFRILESFALTAGDKRRGKHLSIETEVWDVRLGGVVFRAECTVQSKSRRMSDSEMIVRSAELLYGLLPKFYFNSVQRNW